MGKNHKKQWEIKKFAILSGIDISNSNANRNWLGH